MRALGVLLAIVALALGVYWWTSTRAPELREVNGAAPLAESSAAGAQPSPELEIPPAVVPPLATEALAPSETAEHVPVEIPPVDFEAKYKNYSIEQLAGAKHAVGQRFMNECKPVFEARFQAGQFEQELLDPGQDSRPRTGTYQSRGGLMNADGKMVITVIELPVEEYPLLHALKQEEAWINSKLNELRPTKKG